MRALKLFRRADDRPSLKDRAAALKARLARITRRPDDADPSRRIMVAGSLAAAFPLPALAARAVPAGPHPDQAVLDAEAAMLAAERAHQEARCASSAAFDAVWVELGPCPASLIVPPRENDALAGPTASRCVRFCSLFQWVVVDGESAHAWTAKGLRIVIARGVSVLGRGGQTPHRIRRWKALLPEADAFDARRAEVEAKHRLHELSQAYTDTGNAWTAAQHTLNATTATTAAGLAVIARHVNECGWKRMPPNWRNLLVSAANVSGVELRDPIEPRQTITFY